MLGESKPFSGFSVDDIEIAKAFYGEKLGVQIADEPGVGFHMTFPNGHNVFVYSKPGHVPAEFTVLNFRVDNIDQAVEQLTQNGLTFERYDNMPAAQDEKAILRGLSANMGPDIAWFKDPAGNILSVVQEV